MFFRRQWPAIIWALFILIITGIPGSYIPGITTFWKWLQPDKIVHVLVFSILSFAILYGERSQYSQSNRRYYYVVIAIGGTAVYGLLTEVLQHYVFIGRSGNVYDVMADLAGAIAGWMLFIWASQKKKLKNNNATAN